MVYDWNRSEAIYHLGNSELYSHITTALVKLSRHFANLPLELSDDIVQQLEHDDLRALIGVNRIIRNALLPSLKYGASYFDTRDPINRYYQGDFYRQHDTKNVLEDWKAYIKYSFRSRKLDLHITDFRLKIYRNWPSQLTSIETDGNPSTQFYASPLSWPYITVAGMFLTPILTHHTNRKIINGLRKGYLDATLLVLISLMKDLQNLSLPLSLVQTSPCLKAGLKELLPRCKSLVSVNIGGVYLNRQLQMVKVISCYDYSIRLALKEKSGNGSVDTIQNGENTNALTAINDECNDPWPFPNQHTWDHLETLDVTSSSLSLDQIGNIVATSPALTALQFEHGFHEYWRPRIYDCDKLTLALAGARFRLEKLIIACKYYMSRSGTSRQRIQGSIGGILKQFTRLHSLDIPPILLLGETIDPSTDLTDSLPAGLKTLILRADSCIRGGPQWMMTFTKVLDNFVRRGIHVSKMSRLRLFEVHLCQYYVGWGLDTASRIWEFSDELRETYGKLLSEANIRGGVDETVASSLLDGD